MAIPDDKQRQVLDTEATVYVYSSGKLVAEYSTATPPSNPTVNYTATDLLGSPRVLTNSLGEVVSRRDFLPFGEELYADGQSRTTANKYTVSGQDTVRVRGLRGRWELRTLPPLRHRCRDTPPRA